MKITKEFQAFFDSEKSGGILLILCTVLSLLLANSVFSIDYISFWSLKIVNQSISHWINDGLMTIFFLLIGLELEREIYKGELSTIKSALLPTFAAIGGMLVPACFHIALNIDTIYKPGAGIPMATDIAFAIGILSLIKNVPVSLKIFLTAVAVIDDLGSIVVIAIGYTQNLSLTNLGASLLVFLILLILNRLKVHKTIPYLIGGILMWFFMLNSGIHPTITGVMLAFALPFDTGNENSPSFKVQNYLHAPAALIILPLFALANTCLKIESNWYEGLLESNSLGIMIGLVLGKPIGIVLFTFFAVISNICSLPEDITWSHIIGAGFLGGIGFTMSIFIALLAFDENQIINQSKIAILVASLASGTIGYLYLSRISRMKIQR